MSKVNSAIIMAAGLGNRMHPLTLETPKPLIPVNGKRMIESIIESLIFNNITRIYAVVGYKKEQFYYLKKKYGVELIDNPDFEKYNNISSLYVARDFIPESMILDGDQIINDPSVLCKEFSRSGYNAVWTDEETTE